MRQRILITGGKGTLAQAIARTFTQDHHVDQPGRQELDVTQALTHHHAFSLPLSLLVCNAGITRDAPLARLSPAQWHETLEVNLLGALRCARAAIPALLAGHHPQILFISSFSALHPPVGQTAYATAKAALLGATQALAAELGPSNIRVNAILPGFFLSPLTRALHPKLQEQSRQRHTLGRFNTPENAAAFIRFLHLHLPHTSAQIFQLDSRPHDPQLPH